MPLIPCPRCQRHVRSDESSCPFCASKLPAAVAGIAAAAALALAGCGPKHTNTQPPPGNTDNTAPAPDAAVDEPPPPPPDNGGGDVRPLYGVDRP